MMKTKFQALCFIGTLLLVSLPVTQSNLLAREIKQSTGGRVTQNASVPSSFDDYRKECMQRSTRQGLPQDVALDLCNCTIKKFQSQYNFPQFRALVVKSKNDRTAARTLTAVGETCFDEVLYE